MSIWAYPQEVHDFVRENCKKYRDAELAERCNELLGTEFTKSKMQAFRANHGYKSGFGNLTHEEIISQGIYYPVGLYEFIRDNSYHVSAEKMAKMIKEKFDYDMTPKQVASYRTRHRLLTGEPYWWRKGVPPTNKGKTIDEYMSPETAAKVRKTAFKKGKKPHNKVPVGTEVYKKGFKYHKVKDNEVGKDWRDAWKLVHHEVWEDHNGPIPDGYCVVFKDRNRENCNIDNLILMKRGELGTMAIKGYLSECPEATEARLTLVRIDNAKKKRRKGKTNG